MFGDYSGAHGGEAQHRGPSAGHLVNECQSVLVEPQTGKTGNVGPG